MKQCTRCGNSAKEVSGDGYCLHCFLERLCAVLKEHDMEFEQAEITICDGPSEKINFN